ncbi:LL-diaminopimelate aminotransferase [Desulfovibrio ferrophilus]|uniref:Aminotransferase n=1 Tax=Desulfovibrio ferrophilus TaxID=241368 RepID=A0A2Z6AX07_9BACT|nr:LL-diaminopimelate aminotransferase [Desulfovibrio ferrophilus]BBD07686.1 LL-diaminopimelate aminotransferase [Desulfovibrio ferrophilus]
MPDFKLAQRIAELPPYLFAQIDAVKREVAARGVDIISLGIGDPDLPTPDFIIDKLAESARKAPNHRYPDYEGMLSFRTAVATWYKQRFDVDLNPATEVVSLIGSKEGIAHFPLAFTNPGDMNLVCTPNYPVYPIATKFAGGEVEFVPLTEDNAYLPDLDAISDESWAKAKSIYLNYPNNPTAGVADDAFFEKLIKKCIETETIIVHDAAYTEIYFDPANKPKSIMEYAGAKEVAIEFHSLSKTYNMTGWRVAMAVGNATLVGGLGKVKTNVDSGIFQAVQEAGIAALEQGEPYAEKFRGIYRERRDAVVAALRKAGIKCPLPDASFYIWANVPEGYNSSDFVTKVIQETGVVLTPGNGFGAPGEGYFRISLTVPTERLEEAVSRIASL